MMKNLVALLLLALWLALGSWYYTCKVKQLCVSTSTPPIIQAPSKTVKTGKEISAGLLKNAYLNIFRAEADVQFQDSQEIVDAGPVFHSSIDSIVRFLEQHPSVTLTITAPYSETEENFSSYENLGFARAASIQQQFEGKGIPAEQIMLEAAINNDLLRMAKAIMN